MTATADKLSESTLLDSRGLNSLRVIPSAANAMWTDGALLTNPTSGATLVSLTGLSAGNYFVGIFGSGSAAWVYDFQHQNSGGTVLHTQRFRVAGSVDEVVIISSPLTVSVGDKFVCVLQEADVVGKVQVSLVTQLWG